VKVPIFPRKIAAFDLEKTMLDGETMVYLGRYLGCEDYMRAITEAGMRGELSFYESMTSRFEVIKRLKKYEILDIVEWIPLVPGVEKTLEQMKNEYMIVIVTGCLDFIAQHVTRVLPIDKIYASKTIFNDERPEKVYPIMDKRGPIESLSRIYKPVEIVAVGDGVNDIPMFDVADISIGFQPKQIVRQHVDHVIEEKNFERILNVLGK
jgi:phosphoserine phosphatase